MTTGKSMRRLVTGAVLVAGVTAGQLAGARSPDGTLSSDSASAAVHIQVVTIRSVAYPYALQAAEAALARCASKGQRTAVVIVDSAGNTRMIMVGDGASPGLVEGARRKAYTAAQMRQSTAALQQALAAHPHMLIPPNSTFLIAAGGVPFFAGNQVVGGIGVEGGNPQDMDECAQAGVDALRRQLHPAPPQGRR